MVGLLFFDIGVVGADQEEGLAKLYEVDEADEVILTLSGEPTSPLKDLVD